MVRFKWIDLPRLLEGTKVSLFIDIFNLNKENSRDRMIYRSIDRSREREREREKKKYIYIY